MVVVELLLAAAPSVALMIFFYLKDRYEPEPHGHIAAAFGFGALAFAAPFVDAHFRLWEELVSREWLALGGSWARLFEAYVMAGATEELAKWLLVCLFIYRWEEFDEPFDAVIYCVAVALGFATVENMFYVLRAGVAVGLQRAVLAVPAHALYGAVMGYYLGCRKHPALGRRPRPTLDLLSALLLPLLFHGSFDFAALVLRGVWMWLIAILLSLTLWVFVLYRVDHAVESSPFKRGK